MILNAIRRNLSFVEEFIKFRQLFLHLIKYLSKHVIVEDEGDDIDFDNCVYCKSFLHCRYCVIE
jgi:hypothetical protein